MSKIYLHVDINSYFATLIQQETPALRGQPVGIVKEAGRGCIIAASKEAKRLGIKTGCLTKEARLICPHIQLVPAQFDMYLSATRQLRDLFYDLSPDVDIFSLDEAFIDYTSLQHVYSSPHIFGEKVQARIKQTLGEWVTCNIGIAATKLLAKMSSEVSAKGSITQVTEDNKALLLSSATFAEVCGVGFRLAAKLKRLGVEHPYQINFIDPDQLETVFGPFWSIQLQRIGQGLDPHFLIHKRDTPHMKSVSRSITGFKLARTETAVQQVLYNLCAEVMFKTRKMKLAGRLAHVSLTGSSRVYNHQSPQETTADGWQQRTKDQSYWSGHSTQQQFIQHTQELYDVIYHQLAEHRPEKFPIIRFRVGLSLMKPTDQIPQVLWPEWWKKELVEQACDDLTQRYGLFTVRSGKLMTDRLIKPEVTGFFGDKDFYL